MFALHSEVTVRLKAIAFLLCLATAAGAEESPVHGDLRALHKRALDALNAGSLDALLAELDPRIVFTTTDAALASGHAGVKAYFDKMMTGPERLVQKAHYTLVVDELSHVYGDHTAVATGTSTDEYTLSNGADFTVKSRFTATMVQRDGRWWIAAFHTSTDMFDNPILDGAKRWLMIAAGIAGAVGLLLGVLLAKVLGRKRP